jgi:hypothetical protein
VQGELDFSAADQRSSREADARVTAFAETQKISKAIYKLALMNSIEIMHG